MHSTEKRSQSEKATSCMIPSMWHSGKSKTLETVNISVKNCKGWGGTDRWIGRAQGFLVQWYTVWYCNSGNISLHICSIHRMYDTKSDSSVSCAIWMVMMNHCRFINCNKCALWWEMLIMREARHVWRQNMHEKSLYLSQCFCELKTDLKQTNYKNIMSS